MVEVTGFNNQDNPRLDAWERVGNSDHRCTGDTRSHSVVVPYILDNVGVVEMGL